MGRILCLLFGHKKKLMVVGKNDYFIAMMSGTTVHKARECSRCSCLYLEEDTK